MLTRMKSKADVKKLISKMRKSVDPKFSKDINAIADTLDELVDDAAKSFGRSGGRARAVKLSAKRKKEIASNASRARWGKNGKSKQ